jgi:hypothetical protein
MLASSIDENHNHLALDECTRTRTRTSRSRHIGVEGTAAGTPDPNSQTAYQPSLCVVAPAVLGLHVVPHLQQVTNHNVTKVDEFVSSEPLTQPFLPWSFAVGLCGLYCFAATSPTLGETFMQIRLHCAFACDCPPARPRLIEIERQCILKEKKVLALVAFLQHLMQHLDHRQALGLGFLRVGR